MVWQVVWVHMSHTFLMHYLSMSMDRLKSLANSALCYALCYAQHRFQTVMWYLYALREVIRSLWWQEEDVLFERDPSGQLRELGSGAFGKVLSGKQASLLHYCVVEQGQNQIQSSSHAHALTAWWQ